MFSSYGISLVVTLISLTILLAVDKLVKKRIKILIFFLFLTESTVLTFFFDKYPNSLSVFVLLTSIILLIKNIDLLTTEIIKSNKLFSYYYKTVPLTLICSFLLFFSVIVYEFFSDRNFSQTDAMVFTLAFILLIYDYIPSSYAKELDFLVIFFSILFIVEVIPMVTYKILFDEVGISSDGWINNEKVVNALLAVPLSNLLNLLGYTSHSDGFIVYFENLESGLYQGVSISEGCSGIISIKVFLAGILSFQIYSNNKLLSIESFVFIILGLMVAYFANLLRMLVIVLVGHYFGIESLNFVHQYLGWIIFTVWVLIFYAMLFNYYNYKINEPDK